MQQIPGEMKAAQAGDVRPRQQAAYFSGLGGIFIRAGKILHYISKFHPSETFHLGCKAELFPAR